MRELEECFCQANTFRIELGNPPFKRIALPVNVGRKEQKAAGDGKNYHHHLDTAELEVVPRVLK